MGICKRRNKWCRFFWKGIKNFQEKLRNSNTRLTLGKIKQIDAYKKLCDHISVNTA